ncbi:MAG: DUF1565 domain-containing protein [Phormidesmis sp.]
MLLSSAGGLLARPAQAQSYAPHQTLSQALQPIRRTLTSSSPAPTANYQMLYVDPSSGDDSAAGAEGQPLRSVTRALELAAPNTVIVLAPGRYTQATGEVFPLRLKPGVTLQGTPGERDRTAIIQGGGPFSSASRQSQENVAVVAADQSGIAQIAISNPDGYGLWIESTSPTILETAFVSNRQTGIYATGGSPSIQGSYFSGNQVAGLIVFGASRASIQGNVFEGTGDAIRVIDGATPEIIGNRMTNNSAGLVLIGDARPVLRDNQISGNEINDVVEVATRPQDLSASAALAGGGSVEADNGLSTTATRALSTKFETEQPVIEQPILEQPALEQPILEQPILEQPALEQPSLEADAIPGSLPAGAPGAALDSLRSGISLAPRAVTGENPDSPILNRRNRRSQPDSDRLLEEQGAPPIEENIPAIPSNSNRLAVPNSSIPLGSGGGDIIFLPPTSGAAGGPPTPPSRAQALGLYYRVFVETADPYVQDEVRDVVPDAFRTSFDGQAVMQVGAFPTEDEAQERRRLLEDNNLDVRVEYIR